MPSSINELPLNITNVRNNQHGLLDCDATSKCPKCNKMWLRTISYPYGITGFLALQICEECNPKGKTFVENIKRYMDI